MPYHVKRSRTLSILRFELMALCQKRYRTRSERHRQINFTPKKGEKRGLVGVKRETG
jgi:hypothetical protein